MRITSTDLVVISGISNEYFSDYFKKKMLLLRF